jgi:hypothetical protein
MDPRLKHAGMTIVPEPVMPASTLAREPVMPAWS